MSKFDQITQWMCEGRAGRGWTPDSLRDMIRTLYRLGQVFEIKDGLGQLKFAVGWFFVGDECREPLMRGEPIFFTNKGRHLFPLFVVNRKCGKAMMHKAGRKLRALADERGGRILSFRRGRIMEV